MKLFFNRGLKNKVEHLNLIIFNLEQDKAVLKADNENMSNCIKELKNTLKMVKKYAIEQFKSNKEFNNKLNQYKTANELLEERLLKYQDDLNASIEIIKQLEKEKRRVVFRPSTQYVKEYGELKHENRSK